jgi:hypothetical protein
VRLALAILAALLLAPATAARTERARLWLVEPSPLTVAGSGFDARERVTVTVWTKERRARTVTASATGRWRLVFRAAEVRACEPYSIVAKGDHGSRASLKFMPECPPIQPIDQ